MKSSLRAASALLLILVLSASIFAQDASLPEGAYVISQVNYHIEGITREGALMKTLEELREGTRFATREEFEAYIADQRQQLANIRQFKESSYLDYSVNPAGNVVEVVVDVYTEETWNIIIFPIPEYDSNNGFYVTVKYRDKNFFGSLERFALDLGYENNQGETTYSVVGDFTLPFQLIEHQWYWSTGVDWEYVDGDHDLETYTSLGIDIPFGELTPTFTVKESYNYDTANVDDYWMTTRLSLAESFETGLTLPAFGEFSYTPTLFSELDYKFGDEVAADKSGLEVGFDQSLTAGRVDWIGNVRKGVDFNLTNGNSYNIEHDAWDRSVTSSLSGYTPLPLKILWWPFHASARVSGLYEFDGVEDEAASAIRGIRDQKMGEQVEYGAFLNTDISITAFTIPKIVEGQGSIFFDAGVVRERDIAYDPDKHLKYSVGIEAIGFPLFARSYYIRGSLGFDLKEVLEEGTYTGDNYELFLVLGHHY